MRVALVGANGPVGFGLAEALTARAHVVAVSRDELGLRMLQAQTGCDVVQGDIAAAPDLASRVPPCDVVVCLALARERHPRRTVASSEAIIEGFLHLAGAMRARAVHVSTASLHSERANTAALERRLNWSSPYLLSKSAQERRLRRADGRGVAVLRPANVFGVRNTWGQAILRVLGHGVISDAGSLAAPSNITTLPELADAVLESGGTQPRLVGGAGGFTWDEVLEAVRSGCASSPTDWPHRPLVAGAAVPSDSRRAPSVGPWLRRSALHARAFLPASVTQRPLSTVRLPAPIRTLARATSGPGPGPARVLPSLPHQRSVGGGRDAAILAAGVAPLVHALTLDGWEPGALAADESRPGELRGRGSNPQPTD